MAAAWRARAICNIGYAWRCAVVYKRKRPGGKTADNRLAACLSVLRGINKGILAKKIPVTQRLEIDISMVMKCFCAYDLRKRIIKSNRRGS